MTTTDTPARPMATASAVIPQVPAVAEPTRGTALARIIDHLSEKHTEMPYVYISDSEGPEWTVYSVLHVDGDWVCCAIDEESRQIRAFNVNWVRSVYVPFRHMETP